VAFFIPVIVGLVSFGGLYFLIDALKGRRFAVLGPAFAGKTTMINFLRTGEVTLVYEETEAPTKLKGRKIKLKEYALKVDDILDVPGSKDFHSVWKKQVSKADVICYIFDASRFVKGDTNYIDLVMSEMRHVSEWRKDRARENSILRFFLIGTHLDQVSDYRDADQAGRSSYVSAMWKTSALAKLARIGGGSAARCLAGSLSDRTGCEQLVGRVISDVAAAE
jgi:hypothetical protein